MTKSSIQTRVLFVVIMLSSLISFADDNRSSTTPFLINGKTGINRTSTASISASGNIQWLQARVTAITNAGAIDQTSTAMNTVMTMRI